MCTPKESELTCHSFVSQQFREKMSLKHQHPFAQDGHAGIDCTSTQQQHPARIPARALGSSGTCLSYILSFCLEPVNSTDTNRQLWLNETALFSRIWELLPS